MMGRRFDSYFQETEITQLVRVIIKIRLLICFFIARKGTIGNKKAKKFSFRIENLFHRNEFEIRTKTCLKPEFETLVDD